MALRALSPARAALLGLGLAGLLTAACGRSAVLGVSGVPLAGLLPVAGGHAAVVQAPASLAEPETLAALEGALFARVNVDRAVHGLRPVAQDSQLLETARARAAAQVGAAALSHDDATGSLAFRRLLRSAGVHFTLAGENLARPRVRNGVSAAQLAADAERALMASATHRENILEPRFDRMAVGVARGADGQVVFAQIFRAS